MYSRQGKAHCPSNDPQRNAVSEPIDCTPEEESTHDTYS